jgi:hypothetical protein
MMSSAHEDLALAIAQEKRAWQAVEVHLPGSPAFQPGLWQAWLEAVKRADAARTALAAARSQLS